MLNNITKEQLEQLGVYDLRTFARSVGVVSPTSKKRKTLIQEIINIKLGYQQPKFNLKFGRPVKKISTAEDFLNKMSIVMDKELGKNVKESNIDKQIGVLNFQQDEGYLTPMNSNNIEFKGIVRKTEQGSFYALNDLKINTKTYVLIEDKDVIEYNLIEGDLIEGMASDYNNQGYAKLKHINLINHKETQENIFDLDKQLSVPSAILDDDLKVGKCKLEEVENSNHAIEYIETRAKQYVKKGYKCVVIGFEVSVETKLKLDKIEGVTNIVSLIDDQASFSYDRLVDGQNHMLSLFYHSNDVVVFVLDVLSLYKILDLLYQKVPNLHSEKTEYLIRKLLASCRASNDASITVYGLYYSYQKQKYQNELEDLTRITLN